MDLKKIKIATVKGKNTKLTLDWMQSEGYDVKSHRRFQTVKFGEDAFVSFYGYEDGSVGFSESESYFHNLNWFDATGSVVVPVKPPIGLSPTYIWKSLRVKDILAAMVRYHEAGKAIPATWIEELAELQPKEGV
jgi:hypothetical protein